MIQINCTNCKALLQIDDAFAGGVCRCRHCGTIQTVPKRLKDSGNGNGDPLAQVAAAGSGSSSKTLWQKKTTAGVETGGSGTGLDDLAGIVASSGLSSQRLQKNDRSSKSVTIPPKKDQKTVILLSAAGGIIAILLTVIIVMAVRDKTPAPTDGAPQGGVSNPAPGALANVDTPTPPANTTNKIVPTPPKTTGPSFLGQPIDDRSVVYVLDRGTASLAENRLDLLKLAVLNSVKSLGPQRKFAVMLWHAEGHKTVTAWPKDGLKEANPQNIAELRKFLDDVYGMGQTNSRHSLEKAFKTNADAIVLVPIKTYLDADFRDVALKARSDAKSTAKVYAFSLQQPDLAEQLRPLAAETKGVYKDVSLSELRAAGE